MKSIISLILLSLSVSAGAHASAESRGFVIRLKESRDMARFRDALARNIKSIIPQLNVLVVNALPRGFNTKDHGIAYVEPNRVIRVSETALDLTDSKGLWGMSRINAPEAWKSTVGDKSVVIAVSDTGAWSHGELEPNFWQNPGETGFDAQGKSKSKNKIDDDGNGFVDDVRGWNFETNTKDPQDFHYHGTHVAGTIGALGGNRSGVAGVAWNTSLMITKFLGHDGSGTDTGAAQTILYAADNGAKAINCSWGSYEHSQIIQDAVAYAESKGMLIIAAAGNDGEDHAKLPNYPAAYPNENIISVAALHQGFDNALTSFSSFNADSVDIAAPGFEILSTFNPLQSPLRPHLYFKLSGTSMAAPHVAGVVALLYSANPTLTWVQVKDIILSTATPSPKLAGKVLTGGYLNAAEAVQRAVQLK